MDKLVSVSSLIAGLALQPIKRPENGVAELLIESVWIPQSKVSTVCGMYRRNLVYSIYSVVYTKSQLKEYLKIDG